MFAALGRDPGGGGRIDPLGLSLNSFSYVLGLKNEGELLPFAFSGARECPRDLALSPFFPHKG